jgi:alpha-galactosidase
MYSLDSQPGGTDMIAPLLLAADFHTWAQSPTMGWNSWDCFGTTVTEAQTLQQAEVMEKKLKKHGWKLITVDIQWYEPGSEGHNYRPGAPLVMDGFGRLLPAPNKFPSAASGKGFKPLGDAIHNKGLLFGIHMMRGIPRLAVEKNLPIFGTSYKAKDIANTQSTCPWNPDMYGVDMSKPGAQAYYDSVFAQAAEWGIDFIKVDDLSRPYHQAEVEAIRKAIDKTGRKIVFSTSPGETPLSAGPHVMDHANMWRISDDFWDSWPLMLDQFKRLHDWTPYRKPGAFPDADMLPLGVIGFGRQSGFTKDEQVTLMTLWSIARSPLIFGGDLTKLDDWTASLITNKAVLAVNQKSTNNRQMSRSDSGQVAWVADVPRSKDKYLALFNVSDAVQTVGVTWEGLGLKSVSKVIDLWTGKESPGQGDIVAELPPHGSALYRVVP